MKRGMVACALGACLALCATLTACESTSVSSAPAGSGSAGAPGASSAIAAPSAGDAGADARAATSESSEERALRVHREAIIVDGHNDIPTVIADTGFDIGDDGLAAARKTNTDLARMRAGGITGEFFSIYVDKSYADKGAAARALQLIDLTYRQVERHPDALLLATRADDIVRAKADGKIAVLMGIEGGHAIENSLFVLRDFYRLGVRYMTLTHTNTNDWADSSGMFGPPPVKHHGLTPFGEEVVREMQRIGMLVDISHVSDETFDAALRVATCPVIASHSSARAVANHRRNLSDEMLRALAKNGGLAMVNFWPAFIDPSFIAKSSAWMEANGAKLTAIRSKYKDDPAAMQSEIAKLEMPKPDTPLSVLIDHIEHMAKVAGVDHVGIGSDFDGVPALPRDLDGIDKLPNITRALLARGFSDDDVKKILGGNFLRVMRAAEACAAATKTRLSGDGSLKKP